MSRTTAQPIPARYRLKVKQRLAILEYARTHSLLAASRRFGMEPEDHPGVANALPNEGAPRVDPRLP